MREEKWHVESGSSHYRAIYDEQDRWIAAVYGPHGGPGWPTTAEMERNAGRIAGLPELEARREWLQDAVDEYAAAYHAMSGSALTTREYIDAREALTDMASKPGDAEHGAGADPYAGADIEIHVDRETEGSANG